MLKASLQAPDSLLKLTSRDNPHQGRRQGSHRLRLLWSDATLSDLLQGHLQLGCHCPEPGRYELVQPPAGGLVMASLSAGLLALLFQRRVMTDAKGSIARWCRARLAITPLPMTSLASIIEHPLPSP
jgi:hypothetical protein